MHYASYYKNGLHIRNVDREIHAFETWAERNAWVHANEYDDSGNHLASVVPFSNPELQGVLDELRRTGITPKAGDVIGRYHQH